MIRILILAAFAFFLAIQFTYSQEFRKAVGPYDWSFPEDHGKHPEFRNEWWYFTGHLESEKAIYGFELTVFRFSTPFKTKMNSSWKTDQIYLTHFTVTDPVRNEFYKYELVNREAFKLAGASEKRLDVWNGKYSARQLDGELLINAESVDVTLKLKLDFKKDVVLNGDNGLSRKGSKPGDASYYYSIPRMEGSGKLNIKGKETVVNKAYVWMDREFFTIPETSENGGWDWFAIQLKNGANLMVYRIRDKEGKPTPFSSGTYVDEKGKQHGLDSDEFKITPLEYWNSPETGSRYPLEWNITVPEFGIDINIEPVMNNQELVLEEFLNMNYWEGRCLISGSHAGQAYMELVGYE